MLTRNKLYERKAPEKDAKLLIIFCEGEKTEENYFSFFNGLSSKIKLEIVPHNGNNSPEGLFENACSCILESKENPYPKFKLSSIDEVWFIIDTDEWGEKIKELREKCNNLSWFVAQSNRSFEIWLYYHFHDKKPEIKELEQYVSLKSFLNSKIQGGFDHRKHPIYIETAIVNSKGNLSYDADGYPDLGSTEVHILSEQIFEIVKREISEMKNKIEGN